MNLPRVEKHLEKEFHVSWYIIIYKLILGLIEFISGLALGLLGKQLLRMYTFQVTKELSEEPHDLLARFSERIVPNIFTHDTFLILYLLLLGAAKIAGAIGLMYKQNWGVDLLVGLTVVLFPFQVVELLLHPSFFNLLYKIGRAHV